MSMHILPHPGAAQTIKESQKQSGLFSDEQVMGRCNTDAILGLFFWLCCYPHLLPVSAYLQKCLFLCTHQSRPCTLLVLKTSTLQEKGAVTQQQTFRVFTRTNEFQNQDSPTKPTRVFPHIKTDVRQWEHHYSGTTLKEPRGQGPDLVMAYHDH